MGVVEEGLGSCSVSFWSLRWKNWSGFLLEESVSMWCVYDLYLKNLPSIFIHSVLGKKEEEVKKGKSGEKEVFSFICGEIRERVNFGMTQL